MKKNHPVLHYWTQTKLKCFNHASCTSEKIFFSQRTAIIWLFSQCRGVSLCVNKKNNLHTLEYLQAMNFFILTSSLALKPWKTEIRVVFLTLILVKTAFKLIAYFSTNCFISFSIWLNHSLFALFCLFN